jgi:hypothetical protein
MARWKHGPLEAIGFVMGVVEIFRYFRVDSLFSRIGTLGCRRCLGGAVLALNTGVALSDRGFRGRRVGPEPAAIFTQVPGECWCRDQRAQQQQEMGQRPEHGAVPGDTHGGRRYREMLRRGL